MKEISLLQNEAEVIPSGNWELSSFIIISAICSVYSRVYFLSQEFLPDKLQMIRIFILQACVMKDVPVVLFADHKKLHVSA